MRVFLALRVPPSVLRLAGEVQACAIKRLPRGARVAAVPLSANGHVTLVFLGDVSAQVVTELRTHVTEALRSLALNSAPNLRAQRAIRSFGDRYLVLHVPVKYDDALGRVQDALRTAACAVHAPTSRERRAFQAHITLARVHNLKQAKKPQARRGLRQADQALKAAVPEPDHEIGFEATDVVLYESKKTEEGKTEYEEVWTVPVVQ